MQRHQTIKRGVATLAAGLALAVLSAAAEARVLAELQSHDPATETAAPADPRAAAACRTAAAALLGGGPYGFGTPHYASRDGRAVIRMDVSAAGIPRDPQRVWRAVCVRDPATGEYDAAIFDAPADEIGPRVVILPGPTPEMRPRVAAPEDRFVLRDPAGAALDSEYFGQGYVGGFGFPGLAVPFADSWCVGCRPVVGHLRRHPNVIAGTFATRPMFVPDRRLKSGAFVNKSAFFVKPKAVLGSRATVRFSTGFTIR